MDEPTIDFEKGNGLVPVVVQNHADKSVLMVGYMNEEALQWTRQTGQLHLWSRSRGKLRLIGEQSGNHLLIKRLALDCDGDALLAGVEPATGETPVCHTGADTCFFREL
jgi:phosphoribosyl-ATP pyrophosphohydrolase/phosphoribosyl-AMP cyclohydrolase